ncbi:MAG: hypothetical protein AAF493_15490 [Pseudomonadota bacterium]
MAHIDEGFQALQERTNADDYVQWLGRFCTTECFFGVEPEHGFHLTIAAGTILRMQRGPKRLRSWAFALRAPEASWREFWSTNPKPGFHDVFAMTTDDHARLEGDLAPFLTSLMYFKRMLDTPRGVFAPESIVR